MKPFMVMPEILSDPFINCENHMPVIDIYSGFGNFISSGANHFSAAGVTESAFACIADNMMAMTVWTFIDFAAHL